MEAIQLFVYNIKKTTGIPVVLFIHEKTDYLKLVHVFHHVSAAPAAPRKVVDVKKVSDILVAVNDPPLEAGEPAVGLKSTTAVIFKSLLNNDKQGLLTHQTVQNSHLYQSFRVQKFYPDLIA